MADTKISALTSASTPLAGTEVLPIVQSGTTVKVAVSDLTAGRAVSGLSLALTGSGPVSQFNTGNTSSVRQQYINSGGTFQVGLDSSGGAIFGVPYAGVVWHNANYPIVFGVNNAEVARFDTSGNLVPKTAAKGVNFTANTPAAGMTSQLLNWYEEGTWTPTQGGGLTVVGAFSSTGRYTRIGRQVTISGTVTGATSVAVTAAGIITTNLPFTVVTAGHGNATNAAVNAFAAVICTTTNVTSASAIAATGTITFSATYFV